MTEENQQVNPADATIVTSGLGRKGPEERDLPASLKQDMDLCLHILRDVLGEFDEKLLAVFDDVRLNAVEASAAHFAQMVDAKVTADDGLSKAVSKLNGMNLHDTQLLARAFATYFHLANLCEENYRVSVLHQRECDVEDSMPVDPVNELTCKT